MSSNDPRQNVVTIPNTPAVARKQNWSLPVPPLKRGSAKDGEVDFDSTTLALVQPNVRYLGTMIFQPGGKIGFRRKIVNFTEFTGDDNEWDAYTTAFAQRLAAQGLEWLPGYGPQSALVSAPVNPEEVIVETPGEAMPSDIENGVTTNPEAIVAADRGAEPILQQVEQILDNLPEPVAEHTDLAAKMPEGFVDHRGVAQHRTFTQLRTPDKIQHYVSTPEIADFLDTMKVMASKDKHGCANAMLYGDTSGGKTDGVKQWCAERGYRFIRVDCSTVTDVLDFLGDMVIRATESGPETTFQPSEYIQAMLDPDFAVILLDEVNRVQAPPANNFQMSVLDDTRGLFVRQAGFYLQVKNKLFVGTLNGPMKGSDSAAYVGTQPLDEALVSRFPVALEVKYPPKSKIVKILTKAVPGLDTDLAGAIGNAANELAKHGFHKPNLRELLAAARLIGLGKAPYEALVLTIGRVYPNDGADSLYTTFVKALEGQGITPKGFRNTAGGVTGNDAGPLCDRCGNVKPDLCFCDPAS